MTLRSWIRNLFASRPTRTIRRTPARRHLALECLEDRLTPAPTITSVNVPDRVAEGEVVVSATATDPAGIASYNWTLYDGSGHIVGLDSGSKITVGLDGDQEYIFGLTVKSLDGSYTNLFPSGFAYNVAPT